MSSTKTQTAIARRFCPRTRRSTDVRLVRVRAIPAQTQPDSRTERETQFYSGVIPGERVAGKCTYRRCVTAEGQVCDAQQE